MWSPDDGIDDYTPRWRPFVYQIKGQAEDGLLELAEKTPSLRCYSVRPAIIDYASHDAIRPYIKLPLPLPKKFIKFLMPFLRWRYKEYITLSQDLAMILSQIAMGNWGELKVEGATRDGQIGGNTAIHKMLDEKKGENPKM